MSFEKISNSTFSNFYIIEIWTIAKSISELAERLYNSNTYKGVKEKPGNNILDSSSEPHEIISSVLTHTSRLHKLFQSTSKRDNETDEEYEFRKQRSKYLRKLLLHKKKQSHEIFKSGVRNGIEHFDERIDLMNKKIISKDNQLINKALLYNITLSRKEVFENWEAVLPFKVFIIDSGDYYMVDKDFQEQIISIYEIFIEASKIMDNCKKWAAGQPDEKGKIIENPVGILRTGPHKI
ncbi:MAG: hypothetical protein KKH44_10445 [Bacteroidetes bacterium]|nr:hypothetical protein [Bacteroidota bacterium]